MAAVTQIFYVTNWLHDWYYDSGFTEAAGNAQRDNLGRGGLDGDPLLAEAQDDAIGGSRDNANMDATYDGASPRMQMYLWAGRTSASLSVTPQNASYASNTALFGPQRYEVTGELALALDGCRAPRRRAAGRSRATWPARSPSSTGAGAPSPRRRRARRRRAVGVLIANNRESEGARGCSGEAPEVTTPAQSISQADGSALKAALAASDAPSRSP